MTLYLYALVDERPADTVTLGKGMARRPLTIVAAGGSFAVVEEADAPAVTPASVVAHDRVVRRLTRLFPAVLPIRFGAVARDRTALRALVRPMASELDDAFERVRGAVQFTLRVRGPRARRRPATSTAGPGTRWLSERLAAQRIPEAESLVDATRPLIRAHREERRPSSSDDALGTIYQLVPKKELRGYRSALASAMPRLPRGVTVSVTGPWPPYAFVEAP